MAESPGTVVAKKFTINPMPRKTLQKLSYCWSMLIVTCCCLITPRIGPLTGRLMLSSPGQFIAAHAVAYLYDLQ